MDIRTSTVNIKGNEGEHFEKEKSFFVSVFYTNGFDTVALCSISFSGKRQIQFFRL